VSAMRVRVTPGGLVGGELSVPGDKSIAHRWLIAAAIGRGTSRLTGLSRSLDTRSTAACLARLFPAAGPALEAWASSPPVPAERNGSTWNRGASTLDVLEVEGEGRSHLASPSSPLDCGNSGTTMRLLAGVVAAAPFTTILAGDASLSRRPMERVARPLREMGAHVVTNDGTPPLEITGSDLGGIAFEPEVPSAQVKGAVLLAALAASGTTSVGERVPTRDHTERLLDRLGAPLRRQGGRVELEGPFETGPVEGRVPGDPSGAAFLVGTAALTGSALAIDGVGLNPSRLRWLEVLARMGVVTSTAPDREEFGEPVGRLEAQPASRIRPVRVPLDELPRVIDEVPLLAAVAAHADGASRFEGGAELRVKESDRLTSLVEGIRGLGGEASIDGDDLVIGGGGLRGGTADAAADHRIAMALVVAALAADAPCEVGGVEVAEVSFPGFVPLLRSAGAALEERS
jgi:3-phosphoshikimate 1-carboxyvinyltransferase